MYWKIFCLFFSVFYFIDVNGNEFVGLKHGKIVVCFFSSWAMFKNPPVRFQISDIDPSLCTHIVYAFAGLDERSSTIKSINQWLDIESNGGQAGYKNFTQIKKKYPHIKTILSIGGWDEGSIKFSKMAADKWKMSEFINSVIQYLINYDFDGLNVMWKYPTTRGGSPEDKENFVTLIKKLKEAFLPYGYILTATLSHDRNIINSAYDLVSLNRYLDLIYLLGYDYYGPWSGVVGPLAPLKGFSKEDDRNVEYTIKYMLSFGVSPEKLVLGIPFYGRTLLLSEPDTKYIELGKTKTNNYGLSGPYINGTNFYVYNEICLKLKNGSKWSYHWDKNTSTPYLRDGGRVIIYENARSIANKVKLAIDNDLAGFMVWSIDNDDFQGLCGSLNDTYIDFIESHELSKALIHDNKDEDNLKLKAYEHLKEKLMRLQEQKFINYPLLRTIHQATEIVLEEKTITNVIKDARKSSEGDTNKLSIEGHSRETLGIPCVRTCSEVCFYGTNF
ncbi:unnamed protein product [Euphydryas editha]|uniref:GH18 domain-containing protein n=1 Tax=Euphydryas editha TaxID=104508 RepID=A0AAU9TEZ4_EUPED|nr:unnamed protein product [Euphydryas editha]